MLELLLSWAILSAAFWLTAEILPGFEIASPRRAILVAAIFGIINALLGWFLFVVLGIVTLGIGFLLAFITRWVVNAILLKITDALSSSLRIASFKTALLGALLISLFATFGQWLVHLVIS